METPAIVADLVNGKILRVGEDPSAREQYEQFVATQREAATVASGSSARPR